MGSHLEVWCLSFQTSSLHIEICQFIDICKHQVPLVFLVHMFYLHLMEFIILNFHTSHPSGRVNSQWGILVIIFIIIFAWRNVLHCICCCSVAKSCPTLLWPSGLWPARLLCPWDFPGENTGVSGHFLFQGVFPGNWTHASCIGRWILYCQTTRELLQHM